MNQTLSVPVSPDVLVALQRVAQRDSVSPEQVAAAWLQQNALQQTDPLDAMIGCFESEIPDWLEQHDHYLGQSATSHNR
jgi:hypothetical protein